MSSPRSILLVDDDYISNMITQTKLQEMQLLDRLHVAVNGQEALDFLEISNRTSSDDFPQLVLLDLNMPVVDGFEFLEQLPRLKLRRTPPIVVITSSIDAKDEKRASSYGILGYITKPLTPEKLLPLLEKITSSE